MGEEDVGRAVSEILGGVSGEGGKTFGVLTCNWTKGAPHGYSTSRQILILLDACALCERARARGQSSNPAP